MAGDPYCGATNEPTGLRCSESEGHDSSTLTKGAPVPHSAPASPARESALVWDSPSEEPQWRASRPAR